MARMRSVLSFLLLICLAAPARAVDEPDMAARLVGAGAPDLAMQLARAALQNKEADAAWRDVYWSAAGKSRQRPDMKLPPPRERAEPAAWAGYYLAQADQAAARKNWPEARAYWARALWREGVEPAAVRRAQAGVVQSWLAAGQIARGAEFVNPLMLRLPPEAARLAPSAEQAALNLLDARQPKPALDLLEAQAAQSPLRALAAYRLERLAPEQAEAQLRGQAQGAAAAMAWQGLRRLADDRGDAALLVESLERLVGLEPAWSRHAVDLWRAYFVLAEATANRQHWLVGMDALWLSQAKARLAKSPHEARALLAWLAHRGGDAKLRAQATEALADSLGNWAPRVLGDAPFALPRLAETLRYRLGKQARATGDIALAAGWWEGVAAAVAALPPRVWYLQQAEINVQVRHDARALEWLNLALALREPLTEAETVSVLAQADALLRRGRVDEIEPIARQVFVYAFPARLRGVWQLRGAVAERRGRWAEAAAHYLLAAADASDEQALHARRHAAQDLERAGLIDDVVRQDSLLKPAQDGGNAGPGNASSAR